VPGESQSGDTSVRFFSPFLKYAVFPGLSKLGYLRRRDEAGPAILTYHGILPQDYQVINADLDGSLVSAEGFRRQLQLLKSRYNVISPQQFLGWCEAKEDLPSRAVLVTCDDDLRNTLTEMVPILQEHGLSCLFFVTGASLSEVPAMLWYEQLYLMLLAGTETIALDLGQGDFRMQSATAPQKRRLWWSLVKYLSRYDAGPRQALIDEARLQLRLSDDWSTQLLTAPLRRRFLMLNAAELRALVAAGMEVGAHTLTHPVLSQLSPGSAWSEIAESRCKLEQVVGRPVWALAYPFGDSDSVTAREREMAERAGFTCAFLNVGGGLGAEMPRFALPRVHVTGGMNVGEFEAHVSGFYRLLRQRFLGSV
jgi:peptidoglycan/xylan/chitin deacetylase (PgdA/CDA1 family)